MIRNEYIPARKHGDFKAMGEYPLSNYKVDVSYIYMASFGNEMVIHAPSGPIYITEEQAIAFFGW